MTTQQQARQHSCTFEFVARARRLPQVEQESVLVRMKAWLSRPDPRPHGPSFEDLQLSRVYPYADEWQRLEVRWARTPTGQRLATVWIHDPLAGKWNRL